MSWFIWNSPIVLPNCFLSLQYLVATSRQAWARPTPPAAADSLVWFREEKTIFAPSPGLPRIFSLGTLTLSRKTSPVGEEWDPSLSRPEVLMPAKFLGSMTKAERPFDPAALSV